MGKYDALTKEELVRLLEARDRREATRFGLVWEAGAEPEAGLNADYVALDLVPELCHGPGPWENLVIEGDNFDALRALRPGFSGKFRLLATDPPYNTGNRDFLYNDRFLDKEDLWRHSNGLYFMSQRLSLARDLLAENAAAFIHIDDNEIFHLGLLMNKIFGEKNFVANVIWQKVYSPKGTAMHFSDDHEYILVYARDKSVWRPKLLPRTEKQDKAYKNPDNDPRGPWKPGDFSARNYYGEGTYPITCPSGRVIPHPPTGNYWRYSKKRLHELDADNRIWWGKDGNNVPAVKRFLSEVKQGMVPQTFWSYDEVGHSQEGKKEINAIMDFASSDEVFSTPKPTRLLDRILQIGCDETGWVLDMFAGSGTTGHAVMKANAADGGQRRYVLVSNSEATAEEPEKNLCRDVCAERLRRVAGGYRKTDGTEVPGLGGGFAYLRCRRVAAAELLEMEHPAVWTALQLRHAQRVADYDAAAPFQWLELGGTALCYVPRWNKAVVAGLRRRIEAAGSVTLCSWQPALGRQYFTSPLVCHEGLPAGLTRPFGLRL
jgi:adenine-specific DNA-methyltransferase